jgi:uncharacterized protein (DUF433 family)
MGWSNDLVKFCMSQLTSATAKPLSTTFRYVTSESSVLQGEPIIVGTEVAVRDIVGLWKSGVKPEEIPQHLFDLVTIAQVFDALSFYADYPEKVDRWIERYADHPEPLARLNPLWDSFNQSVADYRREIDVESGL